MGQLAYSEKQQSYEYLLTHSANQMAGLRTRRSPLFGGKDEFAEASTEGNSTPAVSCAPNSAPAQAFALTLAPAPASVPGPPERYIDKDLQKAIKLT